MTEPPLSRLTLGTMRLTGTGGVEQAASLLRHAAEIGITTFHCSSEYESFELFRQARFAVAGASKDQVVIVKVATPHYGEDRFSPSAFRKRTEDYLTALRVDRVIVQWLLRHDLQQGDARLRILHEADAEISDVVSAMKAEGKISAMFAFPYTMPIAEAAVDASWCDGLALYVNPLEHATDDAIARSAAVCKRVIAIRPYAGGRVFTDTLLDARDALDQVLGLAPVTTAVVSASSVAHLDVLRPYLT